MDGLSKEAMFALYSRQFTATAMAAGRDISYITACLSYARALSSQGLPIIYDDRHLAALVGYNLSYVRAAAFAGKRFYRIFSVPKKAGGLREIAEPLPSLKEIQRWILDSILSVPRPSKFAKAFIRNRSVRDNAGYHVRQRLVLSIDFSDFFPSITRLKVFQLFRSMRYSIRVSNMLASLCTLDGKLPQGAPTSPAISNLLCRKLDARLGAYALRNKWRYTRYADDLTFSGSLRPAEVIRTTSRIASDYGFQIHPAKIKVMSRAQRQDVTGIVVNEKLQASLADRRQIRQIAYYVSKYGLDSHLDAISETRANYLAHLLGRIDYMLFLNPGDENLRGCRAAIVSAVDEE